MTELNAYIHLEYITEEGGGYMNNHKHCSLLFLVSNNMCLSIVTVLIVNSTL